jgi:hypothetical protein
MLKSFDLTDNDVKIIQELKTATGAGSAREVVRRALEEYHKKILSSTSPLGERINPPLNSVKPR